MKKIVIILSLLFTSVYCNAQNGALEEYFFISGKIKVVIAVALVIGIGIFLYLWKMDRKITRLENKENEEI